jgi:hypothetical protein
MRNNLIAAALLTCALGASLSSAGEATRREFPADPVEATAFTLLAQHYQQMYEVDASRLYPSVRARLKLDPSTPLAFDRSRAVFIETASASSATPASSTAAGTPPAAAPLQKP